MNDRYKKYVKYICIIAIALFLLLSYFFKDMKFWNLVTTVSTITSIFVILYVTVIWKFNPFEKIPKLQKVYEGILVSTHDNKKRDIKVYIKQNLFEIKIQFASEESSSKSITANLYDEYGTKMLSFGYINNPQAQYKAKSPIHYGMCTLEIKDNGNLEGQYFTDRCTSGDIILKRKNNKN